MNYVHFFQWNIPAENETTGRTDSYINVISKWDGKTFYSDGEPMVNVSGANLSFFDCLKVTNWFKAHSDIEKVARQHFSEIAKAERLAQARAILIEQGEPTGVPTLDYFIASEVDLKLQQTLS